MHAKVQTWGNSLALRIPKVFAEETQISTGSEVELRVDRGRLVVIPKPKPDFTLDALLQKISPKNRHSEVDFGGPEGQEIW